jgi:hypothetical protein
MEDEEGICSLVLLCHMQHIDDRAMNLDPMTEEWLEPASTSTAQQGPGSTLVIRAKVEDYLSGKQTDKPLILAAKIRQFMTSL